ncbi:helix-turn-helix domain-containing protein [Streptomyces sp. CB03238]|uniref:helix-turn-helix domain-containing protein n=1 Tax=Streptomyces sp. CB03238 TaxID=1907777 RepID=UPI0015C41EC3|nr:helix-turn-helix domain-containing protein [Streptomyces sp. CB03238]
MPISAHETRRERLQLGLLEQMRRQAADPSLQRLIAWLADAIDGHVTVTSATGEVLAQAPEGARAVLAPAAHERSRVAIGELKSATLDEGPLKARLLAIGHHAPHAVLATARTEPYPAAVADIVGHVADLVALLLPTTEFKASWQRVRQATTEVGLAIFQLLMGGQVALARRSAASIAPQVLADDVRVYVVDCRAGKREHTAEVIETAIRNCGLARKRTRSEREATAPGVLVVRCPAYDNHLIIVAPAEDGAGQPSGVGRSDSVGETLRKIVADRPGHYLGASETTALTRIADAYRDATRALNVAQHLPERTWQYNGHSQLASMLDDRARQWAEAFLQPLFHAPYQERDHLFTTARLALAFPTTEAAKILDVHRNTVASRFRRVGDLLQLDLSDIRARAVLDLALQIDARAASLPPTPPSSNAVSLEEVLSTCTAHAWAEMTLAPLDQDRRDLRRTLRAWLAHNTSADSAAAELGVHPQTVRGHLRSAERLLQRPLLAGAAGAHEMVIALFIGGRISTLPGDVPPLLPDDVYGVCEATRAHASPRPLWDGRDQANE